MQGELMLEEGEVNYKKFSLSWKPVYKSNNWFHNDIDRTIDMSAVWECPWTF